MRSRFAYLLFPLLALSVTLTAQIQPTPNLPVQPVPLPGGDVLTNPDGSNALWASFVPGVGTFLDGNNAEPNVITNFKGQVAMGYTLGTATDNNGNQYAVITDIRVYQGDYVGGVPIYPGGGSTSAKGYATFVLI
jgi:hypothetical protein